MASPTPETSDGVVKAGVRFFMNLIRLIILAALIALLVAIFIPATNFADNGLQNAEQVKRVRAELLALDDAVMRDGAYSGELGEAELNAYLYDVVHHRNKAVTGLKPESLVVDLEEGSIDVAVMSRVGFLPISYRMVVEPQNLEGGGFTSTVTRASVGQLPMPGPLADVVQQKFAALFSGMPSESKLFDKLEGLTPSTDTLRFRTNRLPEE